MFSQAIIDERWERWRAQCAIASRREFDPAGRFAVYRDVHRLRLELCAAQHLSLSVIKRHDLDDPGTPFEKFSLALREAVERRRARMGRVKGLVKHPRKRKT
jgi:hypothetical protein